MKRKILLLIYIGILGAAAYGHELAPEGNFLNFKVGISDGSLEFKGEKGDEYGDQDTSANISLHLEHVVTNPSGLEHGVGLGFLKGETNEHDDIRTAIENINTYPLYGLLRYRIDRETDWDPYIFANLGYAYADEEFIHSDGNGGEIAGDIEGGIYYAFGFGAEYQESYSVELIFSRTEAEWDEGSYSGDINVDLITLAMGYRLDRR